MMRAEMFTSCTGLQHWIAQDVMKQMQIDPTHSGPHWFHPVNQLGIWLHWIHLHSSDVFAGS